MAKVFRSPDGYKEEAEAPAQSQQPTVVSTSTTPGVLADPVPGKNLILEAGDAQPVGGYVLYGFGILDGSTTVELVVNPDALPPTAAPVLTQGAVVSDAGTTPGSIAFTLAPAPLIADNAGSYFLVVTRTDSGLRDVVPLQINTGA